MEWLQTLLDNSSVPLFTAFLLGLLTALSPCPMATNITAIGYISRRIENRRKVFFCGIAYTLGRMMTYSVLGIILILLIRSGRDMYFIQQAVSRWGEALLPAALVIIGVLLLLGDRISWPSPGIPLASKTEKRSGVWGSFIIGALFSLAFCPTSGLLYFGMLIPMSASESGGWLLPVAYAITTGLPVVLVAWFLAFSMSNIGKVYGRMQVFQKWLNIIVAVLFIAVGIYYGLQYLN
ncbi:MAG: aromatic aminobenezylarsenical efflux permease ArsG family transporter [Prevotellaceae bacterium]|nr:aromatic aminobenezylarsenical efflux permease ArsG family transporter [Prevotella sp.]MDD7258565.1 aromatic aminobenezylarsenical efflux permease ArsG family transporter [Prevotellaceae bacterium]MDY6131489.1 aromatic aminobenezylarsenical efflux permease ArsG family transporter [Prevotella sp.]